VLVDRRARELERRRQVAHIQQTRRMTRGQPEKAWQRVKGAEARQIAHVALDLGFDVVAVPSAAPRHRAPGKRRRVTARCNALGQAYAKASTEALSAVNNAGARCTSSRITRAGSSATNPTGSRSAAARTASSSNE